MTKKKLYDEYNSYRKRNPCTRLKHPRYSVQFLKRHSSLSESEALAFIRKSMLKDISCEMGGWSLMPRIG